jgi:hypothetical protein
MGFSTKDAIQAAKTKDGEKKLQRKPVPVLHLTKIKPIATGNNHVIALDSKGKPMLGAQESKINLVVA